MGQQSTQQSQRAAFLVIGDEILSGRTKDKNIGVLADHLTLLGIDLTEVRIVSDEVAHIVDALNALRSAYDVVFTSGGIGPTHDDKTAEAVAKAFGVELATHEEANARLERYYDETEREYNAARRKMAIMPEGVSLIDNPISIAPGFTMSNVHVMAGVPSIFKAMLHNVTPQLAVGAQVISKSVPFSVGEGTLADDLTRLQEVHSNVSLGSYPRLVDGAFTTEIVIRGRDAQAVEAAYQDVAKLAAKSAADDGQ